MSQPPDRDFTLRPDFEPVDVAVWRAQVEADLRGAPFEKRLVTHTIEGLDVQPLYARESAPSGDFAGFPGFAPQARGSAPLPNALEGWDVRQLCRLADPAAANAALLDDLAKGARSVRLEVADALGAPGLRFETAADVARAVRDLDPTAATVALAAGNAGWPVAAALLAHWQAEGFDRSAVRAELGLDPLGALARSGHLSSSSSHALARLADAAAYCRKQWPAARSLAVDTGAYHDAGASATQELAFAMATGVAYLRALESGGLPPEAGAAQLVFRLRLGTRFFMGVAKLRAARRLWDRILETCGVADGERALRMEVGLGARVLTRRDPWVNLLRNTAAVFAGAVGGADAVLCEPFDAALGASAELSRRLARNTQIVLQEESALARVVDPAGGAWMIESWTAELAERAWALFQTIERLGGMAAVLTSGWVAEQVAGTAAERAKRVASRRDRIVGVTDFPALDEVAPATPAPPSGETAASPRPDTHPALVAAVRDEIARLDGGALPHGGLLAALVAAAPHAGLDELRALLATPAESVTVVPLSVRRLAEPFERLRDRSDAYVHKTGARPRVFLANLGPIGEHNARAAFARGLFDAGGLEAVGHDGFDEVEPMRAAFRESGALLAAICSSDARYALQAAPVARALSESGALAVVLAGRPGALEPVYREAGVTHFMFLGGDVLALLESLWERVPEVVP